MPLQAPVVQVVRRFGRVGGMEGYVWHLCHELARLGERVLVVCETRAEPPEHPGIEVVECGRRLSRPRWLAYLMFSRQVHRTIAGLDGPHPVIHSHERTGVHHVTTLHSDPFTSARELPWAARLSPRIAAYRWMEQREIHGGRGGPPCVVPVSHTLQSVLARRHPAAARAISAPIPPGVQAPAKRPPRRAPADGGVIGFVGHEWERKGLPHLLEVASELARTRPALELLIIGPQAAQVEPLCRAAGVRARCLGWTDSRPYYAAMDLLVHPARSEAYGMVIAEALASGVPVVVSDRCGAAADVPDSNGSVLSLDAPVARWAACCNDWLNRDPVASLTVRSWTDVAQSYREIYRDIVARRPRTAHRRP
ncbi:glycosyltransferase family 4 protein [Ramlibacter rhizophilus]|nr:glycosyltransferase family 4 protein [Ramlibacter rhizophilus]